MVSENNGDESERLTELIEKCIDENTSEVPFVGGNIDSIIVSSIIDLLEKLISASSSDNDDFRNRLKFVDNCVLFIGGIIDGTEYNKRISEFGEG